MVQGSKAAVEWWKLNHLTKIIENCNDSSSLSCESTSDVVRISSESDPVATSGQPPVPITDTPQSKSSVYVQTSPSSSSNQILERIDRLETSMADLFGILSTEKVNFIRDAAEREIDILKCEIKVKDKDVIRLKEELAHVKKKDDMKTKEIQKLKDEICELRKAASIHIDASKDKEISVLKQDVCNLRENLRLGQEENGKNKKTQFTNDGFDSANVSNMHSLIGGPENEKSDGDEWQTISRSKFSNPDVLIVGNSNVRKLNPRLFHPEFTVKHLLNDKTLSGAITFLKNTDVRPRKNIILQVIDNDIGNVTNDEIISMIEQLISVCENRFPGVKLFVLEPLGRCTNNGARLYWDRASQICRMLASLAGIRIIKIPSSLKNADSVLYDHERGGFIHLNGEGIRVLSDVYKRVLIEERSVYGMRDTGRVRNFRDMKKNNVALRGFSRVGDAGLRKTTEVRKFHDKRDGGSSDVTGSHRDCRITNSGGDDSFGQLINTLIEGLARFR